MSYQLPDRRLLIHKAIDVEKLSAKNAPRLNSDGLPHHLDYSWERKYDGCSVIVVIGEDLTVSYFSRDGKPCTSLTHLTPHLQRLPRDIVLFGEAWQGGKEFREISGSFRRKAVQPELCLVVFDTVLLSEFEAGISHTPYRQRRETCHKYVHRVGFRGVSLSQLCEPWEVGTLASREDEAYDGAVAKLWAGTWVAGAGTGGEVLKVKNVVDVDLEVIGVTQAHDKNGNPKQEVGSLVCRYENGVELGVGTGLTELQRRAWWLDRFDIIGRVVRVVGMKDSGKGSLREPRFKGVRHDKDTPDF